MRYILLVLLVIALVACSPAEPADTSIDSNSPAENKAPEPAPEDTGTIESEPDVTFVVTGENFAFFMDGEENPELRVEQGDLVRIEFTSTQGFHDWVLDEFDAATERVMAGDGMTAVEFVADEAGTFEYYCGVGSHRANGMFGSFVVE